jgi:hypothetical protein
MAKAKAKESEMFERIPLPKGCDKCECDSSLVLTSSCHTGAPVFAVLAGNILSLECSECNNVITRLEVTCQIRMK